MIVFIFFVISALFIVSEKNISFSKAEDREKFFNFYYSWILHLFNNSKNIVGYVVKLDWLPK